jgi:hypothetical protein
MPDLRLRMSDRNGEEETTPADSLVLFGAMGRPGSREDLPCSVPYCPAWALGHTHDWRCQK